MNRLQVNSLQALCITPPSWLLEMRANILACFTNSKQVWHTFPIQTDTPLSQKMLAVPLVSRTKTLASSRMLSVRQDSIGQMARTHSRPSSISLIWPISLEFRAKELFALYWCFFSWHYSRVLHILGLHSLLRPVSSRWRDSICCSLWTRET